MSERNEGWPAFIILFWIMVVSKTVRKVVGYFSLFLTTIGFTLALVYGHFSLALGITWDPETSDWWRNAGLIGLMFAGWWLASTIMAWFIKLAFKDASEEYFS